MGARLGRYVVLKHLASGGMADVLLGRTEGIEGFERHVVLKRIRPEHAHDQRFIRMFLDEARVAANLHHQHIVQVHDVGESAGEYFIAMEYIHGEDVRTILSNASKTRAHVPLGYAVAIVSAAAAGLHYAHERRGPDKQPLGIVHRDISPSNILVGYDGSIKVVDFGIAKATMRQETRSGSLKGKVSYMSPEQCKSDQIDCRSDVYSLGVVLYELCTTTRLFKGENDYLVMDQIVNGRVSLPQVRRPDLPNELSAIIMRAISVDPERRYFTADELRVALDRFAAKAGLTAPTSGIAAYMRKQFGERAEPWLEIGGHLVGSLDEVPVAVAEPKATSWTELPRVDDNVRRSGPIVRSTGPLGTLPSDAAPTASPEGPRRASVSVPITRPTDSKMGWESQQPAQAPGGFSPAKIALICGPLIALLGFAIWRLAGPGADGAPTAAAQAATQPAHPAPVVTPIQVPPPAPPLPAEVASPVATATPSAADAPKVAARAPEPAPASPKRTGTVTKKSAAKLVEPPSSDAKPEPSPGAKLEAPPAPTPLPAPAGPTASPAPLTPSGPAAPATQNQAIAAPSPAPASPAVPPAASGAAAITSAPPAPALPVGPVQLSKAIVERVAADHQRELSKCEGSEQLRGEITVSFSVDANGKVTRPQLRSSLKKHKVEACILQVVNKWRFPKPGPTGAQGAHTLSFQ
jgi:eukaryotic-like serine/threonine-protein kinase